MSAASRRKGLTGEREVAQRFTEAGWHVRGLESGGDQLCVHVAAIERRETAPTTLLHIEVKRQERLRLPEWLEQARNQAPEGVPPVVCFRQSRGEWYAVLTLDDLLRLVG